MASRKRTIAGSPLTPTSLQQLGAFDEFPLARSSFAPAGNWSHTYRVWVCHGYRETGNYNVGSLRIERVTEKSDKTFTLRVDQQIVHAEGVSNTIHAEIECRSDPLASPVQWHLSSRFIGPDGKLRSGIATDEHVRINGDTIEVTTNGRTFRRKGSNRLTADWCLFEAVQRLPFGRRSHPAFDVLEGLSLLRMGHRLSYRGIVTVPSANDMTLHGFHRLGHGALPYEYWLDERHRLVMAVTLSRAYILDEQAEEKTALALRQERRRFELERGVYEGATTQ